ncbi:HlyC/CorC family transporter [Desulforhopalus vacuolatus]|uniref:CNNM domain-containing protein n=1 Tax=Desulforhopalus vacuolatus TaxID=40414 RepID=UPI001964EE2A|nr:HlyC/CorC family transporter [Desulforhopalus vacuolatus]
MSTLSTDIINIVLAIFLVIINGFFVAAEFALVKIRPGKLEEHVANNKPFAATAHWLTQRMDASLSACQLGITMASLGLGWIGEPAIAHLLRPLLLTAGVVSEIWIHGIAFAVAFTSITAIHLVLGEQAPKIYALRRPEKILLWFALPLKFFYFLSFPFMIALNATTSFLLKKIGVKAVSEHDTVHSEDEIKALLNQSRKQGELSQAEHRLLKAVFEFDDTVCRHIMQPRADIVFFDINRTFLECRSLASQNKHSRYPLCDGSLDNVLGVVHIKDLLDVSPDMEDALRLIARPAQFIPETLQISRLLRQFQETHQHMAFVVDEYGTVIGCITLEDVLERIVGPVEDEFDTSPLQIKPDGPGKFIVPGGTGIDVVNQRLKLHLSSMETETLSGLLTERTGQVLSVGDRIELDGETTAEVLEITGSRATSIRMELSPKPSVES